MEKQALREFLLMVTRCWEIRSFPRTAFADRKDIEPLVDAAKLQDLLHCDLLTKLTYKAPRVVLKVDTPILKPKLCPALTPLILDPKSNALDTLKELKSLMQEVSDPELRARYTECTNYYNKVMNYLTQAEQSLKTEFFTDVARAASNALEMVESCEDQFEVPPSQPSSLEQLNNKERFMSYYLLHSWISAFNCLASF
ncbi:hypothetical protein SLEP1_g18650 [Rubroshorea leprosula]|uniref:Pectinesterase inhibitor domain-containing protein n=1 Tax=Rubroshorea leprosula TaxID=152421 RepID=A0AAV5J3S4_9ROSI|nr:hypothetical protein SLEP1_g18650 [Rubroshorea leprosula]